MAALVVAGADLTVPATPALAASFSKTTLHFDVTVGPANSTKYHCDVVGDLYRPTDATSSQPVPVVLTTNGFGGSKDDQAALAGSLANRGYGVLSYSGLGFGGSGCNIELDDPDFDGQAASQLVTFLGGGSAATNGTTVDWIKHDSAGSDGQSHPFDPRVGMIGGSYGGQVQYAAASIDPRIDTIIPIITWNDLSYSLAPNNTSFQHGVTYGTPGVLKKEWTSFFFSEGTADASQSPPAATDPPTTCPNFDTRACPAIAQMQALGYPQPATLDLARHASLTSYASKVRIPTLVAQGQADTLFNLQESVATYSTLRQQGTPVKLIWQSWGHSNSKPAPGEYDQANLEQSYEGKAFLGWFDHYLKDVGPAPAMDFSYFRDWVPYSGIASPAYTTATSYPVGKEQQLYLGSGLMPKPPTSANSQSFLASPTPTNYSETSAVDSQIGDASRPTDAPGSFASWQSPPLPTNLDVVGVPRMSVTVTDPAATDPGVALFAKLYDVDAGGNLTLVHKLISPIRVSTAQLGHPITVGLPGIVHRFPKGHTLKLVVAGTDAAYSTNLTPQPVTVTSTPNSPGTLTIPVVAGQAISSTGSAGNGSASGTGGTGAGGTAGAGGTSSSGPSSNGAGGPNGTGATTGASSAGSAPAAALTPASASNQANGSSRLPFTGFNLLAVGELAVAAIAAGAAAVVGSRRRRSAGASEGAGSPATR